jgi:density-regulated protein DRP1
LLQKKKKPKGGGAAAPKKAAVMDTKVIISRIQRQKKKYVTVIAGLETVPDLKLKDATKVFGKKFSSGASINETQTGAKEVVIQGDVSFDVPAVLVSEFKVGSSCFHSFLFLFIVSRLLISYRFNHPLSFISITVT